VDRVWSVFTDIAAGAERLSAVEHLEMLTEQPFGTGTRWRETRQMFGKSATEEMWVTDVEPMRFYVVEADSHGTHYTSRYDFSSPNSSTTTVTFSFSGSSRGVMKLLGAAMWPLLKGKMTTELRRDLDELAQACESAASD
jgi:hypothetical protein